MENVPTEILTQMKKDFAWERTMALAIMNGENEYDGADGARVVLNLCKLFYMLFPETKEFEKEFERRVNDNS